jgi:hypothetical protein
MRHVDINHKESNQMTGIAFLGNVAISWLLRYKKHCSIDWLIYIWSKIGNGQSVNVLLMDYDVTREDG